MQIQQNSWKQLHDLLPCSGCAAGKMRKTNKATPFNYTDINQLVLKQLVTFFNYAVSRTAATTEQINTRNEDVALDWAIVNKTALPGQPNVFAIFLDRNIGIVHTVCTTSRGLAGEALLHYIQQWGVPKKYSPRQCGRISSREIRRDMQRKRNRADPISPLHS